MFIQTVKCSFFNQLIVYQSFYGVLVAISYFLVKEKFCFARVGSQQVVTFEIGFISKAFRRPCQNNYISRFSLTQIVHSNGKMLFLKKMIIYQSFYGALLTFIYFLLQGKVLFRHALARCSEDLVEKNCISGSI